MHRGEQVHVWGHVGSASCRERLCMSASADPAKKYYFINVLGRGQLIDWESSNKRGPRRGKENKRFYTLVWPPDQWVMKAPPPGHPAIWHEAKKVVDDLVYVGTGTHVFVTKAL